MKAIGSLGCAISPEHLPHLRWFYEHLATVVIGMEGSMQETKTNIKQRLQSSLLFPRLSGSYLAHQQQGTGRTEERKNDLSTRQVEVELDELHKA